MFAFWPHQQDLVRRMLGRFAANDELSFNWYDAATLSQQINQSK
ncbi:hypothetical protein KOR34_37250 [Posidoniimonas corsicana]|uniref:Uncharacterized protein n=1 Tax=Posidoniimonas corsicana TaxID=1938618 RepID=A0A5C5V7Q8_9BACT|nr:hypothetical protein [Posidoniimonas corsicana]TWT33889.1 hypothetical protein KOR34_37250 [Posidoniimonas corsicana]